MMPPDRQLDGADEIGAWIERLWRERGRRIGVSARAVRYAILRRGLPAQRIGRVIVADSREVTAWWSSRHTSTASVSVGVVVTGSM